MLGPLLPGLIRRWHIEDAQAGTLFVASFLGQLCGAWFAARNLRLSIISGAACISLGSLALIWSSFSAAHLALFIVGLGIGSGLTSGNVITGTIAASARSRALALLNVAWGIGAIACPLLIASLSRTSSTPFFLLLGLVFAALAILLILTVYVPANPASATGRRYPLPRRTMLLFGLVMLLYVGVENAIGGWLPTYAERLPTPAKAASIALLFWVAELSGRLIFSALTSLLGEITLYRASLALLILAEALLFSITHLSTSGIIALTLLSGFALAPLFPLIISFLLARTGNHPRLGELFASSDLGGASLPWLMGIISTQTHSLRASMIVPAVAAILLLAVSAPIVAAPNVRPSSAT